uniref:T3SS effector HopA1 family protein n=1 Tax=Nocardia violaceofusca TaxID=941182 RepID=UPI003FA39160
MTLRLPSEFPDWLVSACAGHFPEGDEDAMRRCASGWSTFADHWDSEAGRYEQASAAEQLAISGLTSNAKDGRNQQVVADMRNSAKCCRVMADQLNKTAQNVEYTKLLVITTGVALLVQIAVDLALVGPGAMKAAADKARAEVAWKAAGRTLLNRVEADGAAAVLRRGGIPLAKVAAISVGVGAGTGGLVDLSAQAIQKYKFHHRDEIDWSSVGRSAAIGGIAGGAGLAAGLKLAPIVNRAYARAAQQATSKAMKYLARVGPTVVIGTVGGVAGGVAGVGAQVVLTGRLPTKEELKQAVITGFAGGFLGSAAVLAHPGSLPHGPTVTDPGPVRPPSNPDEVIARALADHPDIFDEPRSLRDLRDRMGDDSSFGDLFMLREESHARNGVEPPSLSRESLNDFLHEVWLDREFTFDANDVYSAYAKAYEFNPVNDGRGYVDALGDLSADRPSGARAVYQTSQGVSEFNPSVAAGMSPNDRGFVHYLREGGDSDDVGYRVYVNARGDSAPAMMRSLVHDVIDNPGNFPDVYAAKISGPGSHRPDNIVIYVKDIDSANRVTDWLGGYSDKNPNAFMHLTPAMTHQVMDGVSIGAEPTVEGHSFGTRRAEAIYDGLHETLENGGTFEDFARNVDVQLQSKGIWPDNPFRNVGDSPGAGNARQNQPATAPAAARRGDSGDGRGVVTPDPRTTGEQPPPVPPGTAAPRGEPVPGVRPEGEQPGEPPVVPGEPTSEGNGSPRYDEFGFDQDGFDMRGYDRNGYDRDGYDRSGYDRDGQPRGGYDEEGYDHNGFDRDGVHRQGYDRQGYDRDGYTREGFDRDGYNKDGYDPRGYDRDGQPRGGYDEDGYDHNGFDREGFDRQGYDWHGYGRDGYNERGYDRDGYDRDGYDRDGYDQDGQPRGGYDEEGYDHNGYDRDGYNRDGYDRFRQPRGGYDEEGYDHNGLDRRGYDKEGYDFRGFDRDGYNRDGFNRYGYDRDGYDKDGYNGFGNPRGGYDEEGYDHNGFDREGVDRNGYDRDGFDRDGFDKEGYDRHGYDAEG